MTGWLGGQIVDWLVGRTDSWMIGQKEGWWINQLVEWVDGGWVTDLSSGIGISSTRAGLHMGMF